MPPPPDLTWIPGTAAAVFGAVIAIDANRRAAVRDRQSAKREVERLTADREARRRDTEREAVLRLVELFQKAHSNTVEPDETDAQRVQIAEDEWREVLYTRTFEEEFPLWWRSLSELSVDAELITDDATRKEVLLCMLVMNEAPEITKLGPWGTHREIVRNVAAVGFAVLGAWLRATPQDRATRAAVTNVGHMQAAFDKHVQSVFERK
ncbi:hypothetical protein [Frigoribacterium sp. Leaf263]|uniref:hypothetical protein n=1 Tax=Frigoribacterium sp. Leaf263 TaxID=1736313 RepID=UPI000A492E92|nr:hypothetical protein [Frigoribacterium sp. Leaf263]